MKTCPDCGETKSLTAFGPRAASPDGRARYCRECFAARSRASYRRRQLRVGRTVRELRELPPGHKWCPDCDTAKPFAAFCRNINGKLGLATYCKDCHNARGRETRQRLYGGGREYHLRRRYGIGQAHVDAMLAEQGGGCAVCGKPDPEHVDHDHRTNEVRGMLCFNCNQALGNVRDSVGVLGRLQDYLLAAAGGPSLPYVEYRVRGVVYELADHRHAGTAG